MKVTRFVLFVLAAALIALGSPFAADEEEKPSVIEGEMVDMKCYLGMGMGGGGKHSKCAVKCAEMGIPAAVVEEGTGKVYTILGPSKGFAQFMGKTVRITGATPEKSIAIIPEKLQVKEGDKWVEAKLPGSMV